MEAKRQFAVSVVLGGAAAGLVLYAASRTWSVTEGYRPVPLPPLAIEESGAELAPALPALGWVGLAAVGALLATRGLARLIVAILLMAAGLGVFVAALAGYGASNDVGAWPFLAMLGGVVLGGVGMTALRYAGQWPAMGSRFERGAADQPDRATPPATAENPDDAAHLWDAIDRGDDPTNR